MNIHKIVINGRSYDGPEAMPPDVRSLYEEAMRAVGPPSAGRGKDGGSTQVFTDQADGLGGSLAVKKVVTVNERTYASADELPPDVRKLYEDALRGEAPQVGATRPKTRLNLSVGLAGPQVGDGDDVVPAHPSPFDPTSTESKLRSIPMTLAIIVVIGLIIWVGMGR